MQRISLEEYFLVAEAVLARPAEEIQRESSIRRVEIALSAPFRTYEGMELYPGLQDKVAALVSRLVCGRPLRDGNKRVALVCAAMLVERNGSRWIPSGDDDAITIERAAIGQLSERELASWAQGHLGSEP